MNGQLFKFFVPGFYLEVFFGIPVDIASEKQFTQWRKKIN